MGKKRTKTYDSLPAWTLDSLPRGESSSSFPKGEERDRKPIRRLRGRFRGIAKDSNAGKALESFPTQKLYPRSVKKRSGRTYFVQVPGHLLAYAKPAGYRLVKRGEKWTIDCFAENREQARVILQTFIQRIRNVYAGGFGDEFRDRPLPEKRADKKKRVIEKRKEEEKRTCANLLRYSNLSQIERKIREVESLPVSAFNVGDQELAEEFRRDRLSALRIAADRCYQRMM